jgi:hypothetical protein
MRGPICGSIKMQDSVPSIQGTPRSQVSDVMHQLSCMCDTSIDVMCTVTPWQAYPPSLTRKHDLHALMP